jgi:hypothetical protein
MVWLNCHHHYICKIKCTYRHDITEILLKVVLNTISPKLTLTLLLYLSQFLRNTQNALLWSQNRSINIDQDMFLADMCLVDILLEDIPKTINLVNNIILTETDKTISDLQRQARQHQTYRDRQDNIRLTETGKTTSDLQRQTRKHQTYRDRLSCLSL